MDEIDVACLRRLILDFDTVYKILKNRYSIAHTIFEQAEPEWSEGIYKSALRISSKLYHFLQLPRCSEERHLRVYGSST